MKNKYYDLLEIMKIQINSYENNNYIYIVNKLIKKLIKN